MKALILRSFLVAGYVAYLISSFQRALLVEWRKAGATVESLEFELIVNTIIPVPPLAEQRAIVAYLDQETSKIDALIAHIQRAIERLREYRTALISAAVTGKIDIRNERSNTST
jgi:restriction endonuclease S subunit